MSAVAAAGRSRRAVRTGPLLAPSVVLLLAWMIVPLAMTLWFSFQHYNLLNPFLTGFAGISNYRFLLKSAGLWNAIANTLIMTGSVLALTVVFGTLLAVVFDQDFKGAASRDCWSSRPSSSCRPSPR